MNLPTKTPTSLVTGGAGFIGSHISEALLATGHRVLILDDLSTGREENVASGCELHIADIRSAEATSLFESESINYVFHHAAQMDVRRSTAEPKFDAEVNILGTLNLLQAAVRGGTKQFIFASTGGAIYGEQESFPAAEDHPTRPVSPYGVSKLACERYLYYFNQEYALNATCLRYANVYGERQNPRGEAGVVAIFLDRLLRNEPCTINGDGLQTRDYVYVRDIVAANLAVMDLSGFQTFNVGTGLETTVVELYSELARAAGSSLEPSHAEAKPGEQFRSVIDSNRIQRQLDLAPPMGLAEGLLPTADWFRRAAANQPDY